MNRNIDFSSKFKSANILSLSIFIISILFILFKGLNYGIDFKGGTLIELRSDSQNINISEIRSSLNSMNLGDVNVKKFGKENDYLVKVEQKTGNNSNLIPEIKKNLVENLNAEINFRRVENVGPKVSSELLQSGIIAISLSLAAMLFYIWIRFEWQFSIGSIVALFHDVIITIGIFSILSLEINLSINETLSRTIITSITTLLALLSIYILGGEILRGFSFAMILGVLIGTYSSIFVAAPVLKFFKVSHKTLEKKEEQIVP